MLQENVTITKLQENSSAEMLQENDTSTKLQENVSIEMLQVNGTATNVRCYATRKWHSH